MEKTELQRVSDELRTKLRQYSNHNGQNATAQNTTPRLNPPVPNPNSNNNNNNNNNNNEVRKDRLASPPPDPQAARQSRPRGVGSERARDPPMLPGRRWSRATNSSTSSSSSGESAPVSRKRLRLHSPPPTARQNRIVASVKGKRNSVRGSTNSSSTNRSSNRRKRSTLIINHRRNINANRRGYVMWVMVCLGVSVLYQNAIAKGTAENAKHLASAFFEWAQDAYKEGLEKLAAAINWRKVEFVCCCMVVDQQDIWNWIEKISVFS